MVAQSGPPTITTSLAAIQGTNGTSTPNGLLKSNADSPATPASTSAAAPTAAAGKPEKAAKPAPRLAIDTTAEQLSAALGDKWEDYGRELNLFIVGKRTRAELQETLDQVLGGDPTLKKLHNNLLMGILANASRDPPPQNGSFSGWNRNKKRKEPITGRVKGSTKQKRLKTEIMALGPAERNRIKAFKAVSELEPVNNPLCNFGVYNYLNGNLTIRPIGNSILLFLGQSWNPDELNRHPGYRRIRISSSYLQLRSRLSRGIMSPWLQKRWNFPRWRIHSIAHREWPPNTC